MGATSNSTAPGAPASGAPAPGARVSVSSLAGRGAPLAAPAAQIARLDEVPIAAGFDERLRQSGQWPLRAAGVTTLQVNVGRVCNQVCRHCHVDAGPDRREAMSAETFELCLEVVRRHRIPIVDITGGAPEMNPGFRAFVEGCRAAGAHVMDRCNLTILETPKHRDLVEFFVDHQVELVCSLPHYRQSSTDRQRGDGVFDASIRALQRLTAAGYGAGDPRWRLCLVTNPVGAFLPGDQQAMERDWKAQLLRLHGVRFDALYCITNLPISRYLEWLEERGQLEEYMGRLVAAWNPATVPGLMCRTTLSVGWDGRLFDCDFNQMLDLEVTAAAPRHIRDFVMGPLAEREIVVGRHCFGCTAGAGSSCGGATT